MSTTCISRAIPGESSSPSIPLFPLQAVWSKVPDTLVALQAQRYTLFSLITDKARIHSWQSRLELGHLQPYAPRALAQMLDRQRYPEMAAADQIYSARLDPRVRVVVLMSECYSGTFANLMYTGTAGALPAGNVCGFFSLTAGRQAYGCYPENEELKLAEAVLPGWMGIRFKPADATVRSRFDLKSGASTVLAVYPDSPAQQAGLEVGDIILGRPDTPFTEPWQTREWIMTTPLGTPTPIQILRGDQRLRLTLTPQRYPLKWPSLPGPPGFAQKP